MKKLALTAFCVMFVMVVLLATASLASANGGPHGGYTATTDGCAGCHRAHTGTGPKLLTVASTEALCMSCHGSMAAGAMTNVTDGVYGQYRTTLGVYTPKTVTGTEGTIGAPLNGGGFANYRVLGQAAFAATTSQHNTATNNQTAAWGLGTANTGQTATLATPLSCASCHDPHGSPNYRILRATINGVAQTVTTSEVTKSYTAENWNAGMSAMCAACHTAYHATAAGAGSTANTGGTPSVTTYRHRDDMSYAIGGNVNPETVGVTYLGVTYTMPLAQTGTGNIVVCSTCHMSHGTSATMTGWASTTPGPAGDSALLRLPNRAVCEVCHQK
jgi:predicted CXXCH cytochrome family protein